MRRGEVLEAVPGMIVSQHSGEGKANQYLPPRLQSRPRHRLLDDRRRGAGEYTHWRARPGYSDLNFLIPELVSGVQYKKGLTSRMKATSPPPAPRTSTMSVGLIRGSSSWAPARTDGAESWAASPRSPADICSARWK